MPLHLAEALEMCKKSMPCLIKKASRCLADCTSKPAKFLSSPFYQTERSYENKFEFVLNKESILFFQL